ncbi:hypothetical protein ET989_09920 [Propioniciclava sinopodophylli]|uniref:Lysozyme n=1 Tax=Propioniciclava sinopodophylli TaxID=1837344 RepID=A0A4V6MV18_9ACTN|nr:GH25 family lysozyme [Propioniciclava sinopodophylli]TBT83978.1 hypothetical protein ET989_09920 [Propioniciclava sinopodophylli]
MGEWGRLRGRWAVLAVAAAMAGCVAPSAFQKGSAPAPSDVAPMASAAVESTAVEVAGAPSPAATPTPAAPAPQGATLPTPSASPVELAEWRDGEGLPGFDVSRYQQTVDWAGLASAGHAFVYVKATEGTAHRSPTHDEQSKAARDAGLIQGAYHYARPNQSSGTLQARFFNSSGGSWTADGHTLPGALDLEFAEDGPECHGLSQAEMRTWVREFSDEYRRLSGRIPVIYTKTEVWDQCTGGDTSFADHPLWLYDHADAPGRLPAGWDRPTLWQRAIVNDLDRSVFFGSRDQLVAWASAPLR